MKNWMKVVALTAFAAIGSVTLAPSAYQQKIPQVPRNCVIIADRVFVNGQLFTSAGRMNLLPGESSPDDEPVQWMQLLNESFSAQTDDPDLGTITWDLDDTRPVETSIIRSNQAGQPFPATVQLDFNVRATISSLPGRVFLSRTPISISNRFPDGPDKDLMNWPPGPLNLGSIDADGDGISDPVEFFDAETGETAFVVDRLTSLVTD